MKAGGVRVTPVGWTLALRRRGGEPSSGRAMHMGGLCSSMQKEGAAAERHGALLAGLREPSTCRVCPMLASWRAMSCSVKNSFLRLCPILVPWCAMVLCQALSRFHPGCAARSQQSRQEPSVLLLERESTHAHKQ
eukprot:1136144-Pelagomonas_calceolata.AAC.3